MNSGTGWVLKVGLNLHLSEAVDISTETCMKGCDEGGWDLQLQRPAVPLSHARPVHGARVSMQQAAVGETVELLTAQASSIGGAGQVVVGFLIACNTTVSLPPTPQ